MNHPSRNSIQTQATSQFALRPIQPSDNEQVAKIIRTVMTEFGCVGEGYSILDAEVADMFEAYNRPGTAFFVIENLEDGKLLGCGGIGPLVGGDGHTCELKKMYFFSPLRGLGFGRKMVETCLEQASSLGYQRCYLETVNRMTQANLLYQKMGFEKIDSKMGATGHCNCDSWYVKSI